MTQFARRWSLAGIATMMLGATALSGSAFAQDRDGRGFDLHRHFAQNFTPDHRGGGGGGGSGGGGTRGGRTPQKPSYPPPPGGEPRGRGGRPRARPREAAVFLPPPYRFYKGVGGAAPRGPP